MISNESPLPLTVVFISQLGTDGASWQPVIRRMTSDVAVFTYDRPGTGATPPRAAPNPPLPWSAFATELDDLLTASGVTGPLIVVGHSVGSLIARAFTDRCFSRIAGAVHIDGSVPRLGLWPALDVPQPPDGDHPDATHFDQVNGEVEILDALVPDVPAAVVTRTPGRWEAEYAATGADVLWTAYQRQLTRQLRTPLIVAGDAGHQIPAEAPDLVAYVVEEVVQAVQDRSRPRFLDVAVVGGSFDEAGW